MSLPLSSSNDSDTVPNATGIPTPSKYQPTEAAVIVAVVSSVCLLVILGNLLVIIAIMVDSRLKGTQNWFLASLALADLLLGVLVMPLTLAKQILGVWIFGSLICTLWLSVDVMLCTASIYHLCLISLDRYFSIRHPLYYPQKIRTQRGALLMLVAVWVLAAIISLPPLVPPFWRSHEELATDHLHHSSSGSTGYTCELTHNMGYVIYSTLGSFYLPMAVLLLVYAQVFMAARHHIVSTSKRLATIAPVSVSNVTVHNNSLLRTETSLETTTADDTEMQMSSQRVFPGRNSFRQQMMTWVSSKRTRKPEDSTLTLPPESYSTAVESVPIQADFLRRRRKLLRCRERRATFVLGLILGAFILCWFPFFTAYSFSVLSQVDINVVLFDFFFWLGYCNSALNPIIYTVFNREFRLAFQRLLTCSCSMRTTDFMRTASFRR